SVHLDDNVRRRVTVDAMLAVAAVFGHPFFQVVRLTDVDDDTGVGQDDVDRPHLLPVGVPEIVAIASIERHGRSPLGRRLTKVERSRNLYSPLSREARSAWGAAS